jgi:tetrahydromethanopterin S-methyltransferase subunit G
LVGGSTGDDLDASTAIEDRLETIEDKVDATRGCEASAHGNETGISEMACQPFTES